MANPTKYTPAYSFSGFQASNPTKPLPAPRVDDELANLSHTTAETIDALAQIRRPDGQLQNDIVTLLSLSPEVRAAIDANGGSGGGSGGSGGGGGISLPIAIANVSGLRGELDAQRANLLALDRELDGVPTAIGAARDAAVETVLARRGAQNGLAPLGPDGLIPANILPEGSGSGGGGGGGDLGYTPEDVARRNAANGYAGLDGAEHLLASQQGFQPDAAAAPTVFVPLADRLGQVVALTDGADLANPPADWTDLAQVNLDRAVKFGRPFIVPPGRFVLSRRLTVNLAVIDAPFTIQGYGKRLSSLEWVAGAASSGLLVQSAKDRQAIQIENVAFVQRGQGVGTAVTVDFSGQIAPNNGNPVTNDRVSPRGHLKSCYVGGAGNQFTTGWLNGIRVVAPVAFHVYECDFVGNITSPASLTTYTSDTAIYIGNPDGYGHPVECYVERNRIWHTKKGIVFEGCEGAYANYNQLIAINTGIWFKDTLGRPQLCAFGNHINGNGNGILLDNCAQFTIVGNLIYLVTDAGVVGNGVCVQGEFSQCGQIIANQFENTDYTNANAMFNAVVIGRCNGLTVDHNVYRKSNVAGISGVWLQGQAFNCRVGDGEVFRNVSGTPTFEVKDEGAGNMCSGYGLRMIRGSAYGVASGSLRIIPFDTLSEVTGNPGDSMSDGVFVVPSDGVWQFAAGLVLDTGSTGSVTLNIQLNATSGNAIVGTSGYFPSGNLCSLAVSTTPRRFRKGDQIRVGCLPATTRSVQASPNSFFEARRLS